MSSVQRSAASSDSRNVRPSRVAIVKSCATESVSTLPLADIATSNSTYSPISLSLFTVFSYLHVRAASYLSLVATAIDVATDVNTNNVLLFVICYVSINGT